MENTKQVRRILSDFLKKTSGFYLLFSGGFDSSCILGCAVAEGVEVIPVWVDNGFNRADECQIRRQAANLGCPNLEVISMIPDEVVMANQVDRCYFCKRQIILSVIQRKNFPVFDGTNASDKGSYRPGLKALKECEVYSPLARLGITAGQTRQLAVEMGADEGIACLESCLATRFNYKIPVSAVEIKVVRQIENMIVAATGDYDVRCRVDDALHLRIECRKPETLVRLSDPLFSAKIVKVGKKIAEFITLDLEGARKNSYDKLLGL